MDMKGNRITESEWQIMELIWETEEKGITQSQLMAQLKGKWNKNTVHTFLKRLCDKGVLEVRKEANPHTYAALVSRQECEREERTSFLERVYQGSVGRMMASFVRDGGLSRQELMELRRLLDEVEGTKGTLQKEEKAQAPKSTLQKEENE